ncbi:MAG: flagellin [Beijerinckiaceae bacterium]
MANISISAGMRQALSALQTTTMLAAEQQVKLATGKKVNSALDNPASFFIAEGLNNRANDLSNLMDSIGLGVKTLEAADNGMKGITKLVDQAKGLARQALQTSDAATRSTLAAQFDDLRTQIDELAADSGFNGINLLDGDSLTVNFNEDASSTLALTGVTYDSAGLGVAAAANNWAADADINAAMTNLDAATNTVRAQASTFGSNLAVVKNRQEFTRSMVNTLQNGADGLVLADANEEGAKLVTLNTRQQLSTTALTLASQSDQAVLRLFG